jgi:O-antigen/teichoic acid export membrane protein
LTEPIPDSPGSSSIARGAVRGTLWLTSANYVGFAVNILINLLVMRILGRAEVGAYVLAFAVNEFVSILGALTADVALIHFREDEDGTLYDTAYMLAMVLGLVTVAFSVALYFLLALFPPFTPEVRQFIVLLALARPLSFLASIQIASLEIEFRYRALSLAMLLATSLSNLASLGLAWAGGGPMSLVARDLVMAGLTYGIYGLAVRRRCQWRWSARSAAKLFNYSKMWFLNRVFEIVLQRFDRLSIGSGVGKDELGSYHNGRYLAEMGYTFSQPISRLSFNVYSRVKNDLERLNRAYRLVNFFLIRGSVLIAVVLGFMARDLVIATYGPKWLPAVPTTRLLAPYAALLPIFSNLIIMLLARGMMRESVIVRLVQVTVFVPGVLVATFLVGPAATAAALLLASITGIVLVAMYQRNIVQFAGRELFLAPLVSAGIASLAAMIVLAVVPGEGILGAIIRLALVSCTYAVALAAIDRRALGEHYRYLRAMVA